ncbi:MAG: ATP synthase F1 subunit delta [Candidatus Omnitrophica bacterium]|nr:ATP synthase F1 subunit delta [Candidatus Omnitrophota bacterium]
MSRTLVAARYGRAFFMYVAPERCENIDGELRMVSDLFTSMDELMTILTSPVIPTEEQEAFLEKIIEQVQPSEEVGNFIRLLFQKGRLTIIKEIYEDFHERVERKRNHALAEVHTAFPLAQGQVAQLKAKLEHMSKKSLDLNVVKDESLIAGIKVIINDMVYDFNMRHNLDKLRRALLEA